VRFLIDECLTVQLVAVATDHGYEAHHIAHLDRAGQKDWDIARHAQENDFVFITNNAADFRALYATQELHPGLVILIPNVRADLQRRLFTGALEQLAEFGEPVNQVLEVDLEASSTVYTTWQDPLPECAHQLAELHVTLAPYPSGNHSVPSPIGLMSTQRVGRGCCLWMDRPPL
jgi:predicted nuclease of predicted toxin-antitoxin system